MQALALCAETLVPSIHFWDPSRQGSFLPTKAVPSQKRLCGLQLVIF